MYVHIFYVRNHFLYFLCRLTVVRQMWQVAMLVSDLLPMCLLQKPRVKRQVLLMVDQEYEVAEGHLTYVTR